MDVVYLLAIIFGVSGQNIVKKPYTEQTGGKGVYVFGMITGFAAMAFFLISARSIEFDPGILPYALLFGISYAVSTVFSVIAVSCGSLSLTCLIESYSLMLPALYGLIFLHDPIGVGLIPGIVLLAVSLVLINKKEKGVKFSLKWIVSVSLAFFGNGMCSVFQKMQQVKFDGAYKNELMIESLLIVTVIFFIFALIKERKDMAVCIKKGWAWGIGCGIMNGAVNLFVMILSGTMPVSILFPTVSAGGIIVTYIVSRFFYKEKLTAAQFIGFILGIGAVVLLNI